MGKLNNFFKAFFKNVRCVHVKKCLKISACHDVFVCWLPWYHTMVNRHTRSHIQHNCKFSDRKWSWSYGKFWVRWQQCQLLAPSNKAKTIRTVKVKTEKIFWWGTLAFLYFELRLVYAKCLHTQIRIEKNSMSGIILEIAF